MTASSRPAARRAAPLAGIVLAGGRSGRFGADKLAAELQGRPLLWHALVPLAGHVDEIVVVIGPETAEPVLPEVVPSPIVVRDPLPDGGPLVGLLAGLRAVASPVALVIGGDMPSVRPAVLEALIEALAAASGAGLAGLVESGRVGPLPSALRVDVCRPAAERLVLDGERSLRSLGAAVGTAKVAETSWRRIDPEGDSLADVDTPDDLARLRDAPSRRLR